MSEPPPTSSGKIQDGGEPRGGASPGSPSPDRERAAAPSSFDFAPSLSEEERRLAALYRYDVLDSEPEQVFDDIAKLAAQLFDAPIAQVSLIDESRQWMKSCVGLPCQEVPLDESICIYAIQSEGVTVIPDATADERLAEIPMVAGEPGIRFYAGAPLTTSDGQRIGTLCVVDTEPRRSVRESKRQHLRRLAGIVIDELELRREVKERARHQRALEASRQAEEEARRAAEEAQAEAEEANATMTRFFAGIAHDLQTPITRVQLFADLLKRAIDGESNRYIQKIHAASERMSSMVASLQDLAQVRSGQLVLDTQPTDVADVVASACRAAEPDAADRTLETDLPAAPVRAEVDPDAFRRIVENLIGNALKYTAPGDHIAVSVRGPGTALPEPSDGVPDAADGSSSAVRIAVEDTGPGIGDGALDTLFEPFTRGDTDGDGMGLGLAVSKDLAQAMGGDLRVASEVGQGTRFVVHVPATD